MRRTPFPLFLALLFATAFASSAAAAISVHIGVRPDTIPQCHPGRAFVGIANVSDHRVLVRLSLCLRSIDGDSCVFGPFGGRLRLAAGERRHREFRFRVPPSFPPGPYAWTIHAFASDSTHDAAAAPFLVVEGVCPPHEEPATDLEQSIMEGVGLEPDTPTPTLPGTWGKLKRRYR